MKKAILAIALLTMSAAVHAEQKWLFTTPELLISGGAAIGQTNEALNIKFTVQETLCYTDKHFCLNPSLMWLVEQNDDDPAITDFSDKLNIAAGIDLKYTIPTGSTNAMYVEAGPAVFVKRLADHGNDKFNLHVGTGVEYHRYILSINAYSMDNTLYMVNVGYRL